MDRKDFSRREFLRTFAALSSASLLLNMQAGCGDPTATAAYGPGPLYGPAPVDRPTVSGMYFLQGVEKTPLPAQNVPLLTKFTIEFSRDMNTTAPPAVSLTDSIKAEEVAKSTVWETVRIVAVTPSAGLAPETEYTLRLGADAADVDGNLIYLDANASAVFSTVP